MAEATLPEYVQELIEPVDAGSDVGADLDPIDARYQDLEFGIDDKSAAEAYSEKAKTILKDHSKHLQVIAWLSLCWLRMKGVEGFRDSLVLLLESMKAYPGKLFPEDNGHRLKSVEYLNSGPFRGILKRVEANAGNKVLLQEVHQLLGEIAVEYERQFSSDKPDLSVLTDLIEKKTPVNGASPAAQPEAPGVEEGGNNKSASEEEAGETEGDPAETSSDDNPEDLEKITLTKEETGKEDEVEGEEAAEAAGSSEEEQVSEIPEEVEALLEDIAGDSATGEDVEHSSDQEAQVLFQRIGSELEKKSGIDYDQCETWCTEILTERSKHLRVAVWLTIVWFRLKQLPGLRDGLLLISGLLEKYGAKLHPTDVSQQVKILQRLNSDPRLQLLKRIELGDEKAEYFVSDESLKAIRKELREDKKESGGGNDEKMSADQLYKKLQPLKGQKISGKGTFLERLEDLLGSEALEERRPALLTTFETEKAGNERIVFKITERATRALREAGLPEEGLSKLEKDSLDEEFLGWNQCYDRLTIVFGTDTASLFEPVLEVSLNNNLQQLQEVQSILGKVYTQSIEVFLPDAEDGEEKPGHQPPNLDPISGIVNELAGRAREQIASAEERVKAALEEKEELEEQQQKRETSRQAAADRKSSRSVSKKTTDASSDEVLSVRKLDIKAASDADIVFKKAIRFYFEKHAESNDAKEESGQSEEIILEARIFGLSRVFMWGKLSTLPADKTVEGPNEQRQSHFKKLARNLAFKRLISEIEIDFINTQGFLFWFDGQKLVVEALEQLGDKGNEAASEIKFNLARLLTRLPELPDLTFRDEKTPFASAETKEWMEEEVLTSLGGGKGKEKILPPILGEDYAEINEAYDAACEALPEGFEENARAMQVAINRETRARGRFLIRLNLANYYSLSGKHNIARAKFNQLIDDLDAIKIADWEQALCVSLWRSAYLNNQKLLHDELSQTEIHEIESQQRELFEYVGRYDGVLALDLANHDKQ